ncbi:hypothetical protein [Ramlibacter sp. AN1133]|uniref:hypothetical protein n=1 Tax=Ramlibacter sp. AN1133 TaxID=3133429 RepID=UPI0030C102AE
MGKVKGGLTSWLKVLAYPVLRPTRDIRRSAESLREQAKANRQGRKQREAAAKEVTELLAEMSPAEKFEQTVEAWGWTEEALESQQVAARRTRIAALLTGGLGFLGLLGLMLVLQGWVVLVLAAVAIVLATGGVLQAVRFAWWEFQLQSRTLVPLRAFVSRPDLLSRLTSLRSPR